MNDIAAISPSSSERFDQITQHLAIIAQASSGCQQVLSQAPTLHQAAAEHLRNRLIAIRNERGLTVSNPDAIFFNRRDEHGTLVSVAMTDFLIDSMRHGFSGLDISSAAFYLRHDSTGREHALDPLQNRALIESITDFATVLSAWHEGQLSAFWRRKLAFPADAQRVGTVAEILIEQHRRVLQSETALLALAKTVTPAEQALLSGVIAGQVSASLRSVGWMTADGAHRQLSSVYVVGDVSTDRSEDAMFLVMPGKGIERFDSIAHLREALTQRMSEGTPDVHLMNCLPLADQSPPSAGPSIEAAGWTFPALTLPMLQAHIQALQLKQREDLTYLLREDKRGATPSFIARSNRICLCGHLDDAMAFRFGALTAEMDRLVQPHWRKYAKEDSRQYLLQLERAHQARKQKVDALLEKTTSLESFIRTEINDYMRQHLGCVIDPDNVFLTVADTINLGKGDDLKVDYRRSLFDFAVLGLPSVEGPIGISPAPAMLHAEFSERFVRKMLDDLNLHYRFGALLRASYADEETLRAMAHHRDSALALGAWSASMQGHMVQDRSHDMLHLIRGDNRKPGSHLTMGSLHLAQTNARFKDLIVFQERTEADEHFVLYAPGAPGDRDFFEFGSWRQLYQQVGQWLGTDSGRAYVHDQITGPHERGNNAIISNVQLKPATWGADSCVFVPSTGRDFETNLTALVRLRVTQTLYAVEKAAPHIASRPSFANPAVLALVEARIEALSNEFTMLSPGLTSFRDYVHQHTSAALNAHLRSQGYARSVDPDTLYLGLGLPYTDTPDFGEHSTLHNLTTLMMDTREDILQHRPRIHLYSSTGLDATKLPKTLIQFLDKLVRESDMGARYMSFLTNEFLGRRSPLYSRRKALMAKRVQYEMTRDALKMFINGDLNEGQYRWLRSMIVALDKHASKSDSSRASSVSAFTIDKQIIEGVFIFRDFGTRDPAYNLLYTPDAPDGIHFRRLTDYADLLGSVAMQSYCHGRTAYTGQKRVSAFFDWFERGGKDEAAFVRIDNRPENRIPDAEQLYGDMLERIIADIDAQTESLAEQRLALAWRIIDWTVDVLLIPFPKARIVWELIKSVITLSKGVDAYLAGDRATALPLILKGVIGVVSGGKAGHEAIANGTEVVAKTLGRWALDWAKRSYKLHEALKVGA